MRQPLHALEDAELALELGRFGEVRAVEGGRAYFAVGRDGVVRAFLRLPDPGPLTSGGRCVARSAGEAIAVLTKDAADCAAVCSPGSCGDGAQGGEEQCDDGGLLDGDGCSAECQVELEVFCPTVPILGLGDTPGDSSAGTSAFLGGCEGSGLESVYSFTAAAAGTLFVQVAGAHDLSLSILPACDPLAAELGCVNAGGSGVQELTSVALVADQTVYAVADSVGAGVGGPFTLTASFVEQ